ncbi:MAG: hypothetical protein MJ007_02115 [Paludibacteraceae bacterium]|nr:hypothetical protein [Paludibacteraceae bacterium]
MIERSTKYKRIAEKVIQLPEFDDIRDVRIAYLASDEEKKKNYKTVFADCTKVSPRYSWCCKYDFFITVYEPNVLELDRKQLEILMIHELHHVGINTDGQEPSYYVVPHDIEEFDSIIERYGLHWEDK